MSLSVECSRGSWGVSFQFSDLHNKDEENVCVVVCVCVCVGRTSLSLALGNMVVSRQILLVFNLSCLPCSVQFVNKNYCHAKSDLFTTC